MKKVLFSLIFALGIHGAFASQLILTPNEMTPDGPLPIMEWGGGNDFIWNIDVETQGTSMSPSTYYNSGDRLGSGQNNGKLLNVGVHYVFKGLQCAGYTIVADCLALIGNNTLLYATYTVHPYGWTPFASPIDAYVASSTVNADFETLTGFAMRGTHQWIGDYLIKDFIGNLYAFIDAFKFWLIVLFFIGGVLYLAHSAFRFYRH
jgi:hypothetical protein